MDFNPGAEREVLCLMPSLRARNDQRVCFVIGSPLVEAETPHAGAPSASEGMPQKPMIGPRPVVIVIACSTANSHPCQRWMHDNSCCLAYSLISIRFFKGAFWVRQRFRKPSPQSARHSSLRNRYRATHNVAHWRRQSPPDSGSKRVAPPRYPSSSFSRSSHHFVFSAYTNFVSVKSRQVRTRRK